MPFLRISTPLSALCAAAALGLVVFPSSRAYAIETNNADILGIWKLTKVLDSAEITSLDDKEAAQLVGKTLIVESDKVSIARRTCGAPNFERHQEPAAKYVRENYHAPVGRLGLQDTVTIVDLRCTEALIKGTNRVVVFWGGYFYEAEKQMPAKSEPSRKR
jgi:hypothetical protein